MGAGVSAWLVRAWTYVYTFALPSEIQERRRAEIDSDLWESAHDPDVPRHAVVLRLLRGMPADLLWRIEITPGPEQARVAAGLLGAAIMLAMVWVFVRPTAPPPAPRQRSIQINLRLTPPPPPPPHSP
jgi:hypothetical protein